MKMRRKVVISSLTLLSALTLAGSISGTIAWYQYSTRATIAYTGTSAHCSKLLQISSDNGTTWGSDIKNADLPGASFAPITTGAQEKDAPLWKKHKTVPTYDEHGNSIGTQDISSYFYAQPDHGQGLYDNWLLASDSSYAQFDILIKVKDIDGKVKDDNGNDVETNLENDVYLTDLTIEDVNQASHLDLANAVRVHISTSYDDNNGTTETKNFLFAKESEELAVGGFLDVDEDGNYDTVGYEWDRHTCLYGGGTVETVKDPATGEIISETVTSVPYQYSYKANDSTIFAQDDDGILSGGTPIGKTSATSGNYLRVTVTIWLEGWSSLLHGVHGLQDTSIWDAESYVAQNFNVGMTFGVQLHNDNE